MSYTFFLRLLIVLGILFLLDLYIFYGIRAAFSSSRARSIIAWTYWGVTFSFFALVIYMSLNFSRADGPAAPLVKWSMGMFVLLYIPKLVLLLFFGVEDVFRLLRAGGVGLFKLTGSGTEVPYFESRRQFIGWLAGFAALIPAVSILYGITKGKYNYKVHKKELSFKDLPDAFHGLTITQISDLHVGSFDDEEAVERAVKLVNEQNSDIIFFTGDLVNNKASEMEPWVTIFNKLKAPMGKYSILGNHDYGDYSEWDSAQAKRENMLQLYKMHERLGFKLLRNENTHIEKNGQHFELLGMENWGKGFAQYGDLNKTMQGTQDDAFKILLSHDPSHWEEEVMNHKKQIHLTLAGHTHGAQFGVEIPGFRFSPVQFRYKRWAGLYEENSRYLYVNRGLGFIGFPGRVGIWPEITVITLKKA
ncbi:MAG: metallophosphoesterase [Bacteroidia bacterium]